LRHNQLISPILGLESYNQILEIVKIGGKTALCTGVIDGQKCHLAYALAGHTGRPIVIIAENSLRAAEIFGDIAFFEERTHLYPAPDMLSYHAESASREMQIRRFCALDSLIRGECNALVTSIESFMVAMMPKKPFVDGIFELLPGDEMPIEDLAQKLVKLGYERAEAVEGAGQFAIRGGICDIFSPIAENPVRLEFWGDEIDSIRIIDRDTQRSVEPIKKCRIFPACGLIFEPSELENAVDKMKIEYEKILSEHKKGKYSDIGKALQAAIGADIERMSQGQAVAGMEKYSSYFYDSTGALFDFLPDNAILIFDEPVRIMTAGQGSYDEFIRIMQAGLEDGRNLPGQTALWRDYAEVLAKSERFSRVLFSTLPRTLRDFRLDRIAHFEVKTHGVMGIEALREDLAYHMAQNRAVCVLAGSGARAARLAQDLAEDGLNALAVADLEGAEMVRGRITLARGALSRGFEYPQIGLVVMSCGEIFGEDAKKRVRRPAKKRRGARIESFTDLNVGDYVVHDNHGIGIFRGIEKIVIDGISRDYLKINYHGDGALFVAISQLDALSKYIGGDNARPKIHKLGGGEWQKAKSRARGAVEIMAEDLIKLYAQRGAAQGFNFAPDNVWQTEFEDDFAYEETQDQLLAVEDVKRDMESARVMDRLICGDVGYGKTEVAIRAAFKAVNDQKQVVVLVPTTILAQQHYTTFCQRMKDFPISIRVLSRFSSAREQKDTLEKLKQGHVDILIGTHRILSKDVQFRDLGLIVVDEEQRFGVAHKEKLKHFRANVDVMTLTATPIPRTLHMSLSGIRDMSLLEEPPQDRKPITTYVLEYSDRLVADAIMRELSRGGQVFYLRNRVANIGSVAEHLGKLVPQAVVAVAHGQMGEDALENVMMDFISGAIDVLVCTTIIESGLDIPNVNTIIIQDADKMGLSQLYQLRGRVGRSARTSFAFLTYQRDKILTEVAERRLSAIREFTEFGAGFKIAMRDLEIRGAGNLLGSAQHGHMDAVGYEMYCRLLDDTIKSMQGIDVPQKFDTLMEINIDAFIPNNYIPSELQKLEIYKRISHITNQQDFYDVQEEMEDRFGTLPKSAANLLDIALLKANANDIGVVSITQKSLRIIITFKPDAPINPAAITDVVGKSAGRLKLTIGQNPFITFRIKDEHENFMPELMRTILSIREKSESRGE